MKPFLARYIHIHIHTYTHIYTYTYTHIHNIHIQGDVVKVRVRGVSTDKGKLELSMLQYREDSGEEDDYVPEGRDAEGEDAKPVEVDDSNDVEYDAQDTLLWWRGAPYIKVDSSIEAVDEEEDIQKESIDLVEGSTHYTHYTYYMHYNSPASEHAITKEHTSLKFAFVLGCTSFWKEVGLSDARLIDM